MPLKPSFPMIAPRKPGAGQGVDWASPLTRGLQLALPFNEGPGTRFNDYSGAPPTTPGFLGNAGTISTVPGGNGWRPAGPPGEFGSLFFFIGGGNILSLGASTSLATLQAPMTLAGWLNPNASVAGGTPFSQYKSTTGSQLVKMVRTDSGKINYFCSTAAGGFQSFAHTKVLTLGQWYFWIIAVSGSVSSPSLVIGVYSTNYFSEQSFTPAAMSASPDKTVNILIGDSDHGSDTLNGYVGQTYAWNRCLTAAERLALYLGTAPIYLQPSWRSLDLLPLPAAGGGLFRPSGLDGLGAGGPFFADPLN